MLLFSRVPSGLTTGDQACARGNIHSRFGPSDPFANQRRFIGKPSRVPDPKSRDFFEDADVINHQTLGGTRTLFP